MNKFLDWGPLIGGDDLFLPSRLDGIFGRDLKKKIYFRFVNRDGLTNHVKLRQLNGIRLKTK